MSSPQEIKKACHVCLDELPLLSFRIDRSMKHGRSNVCKLCTNQKNRAQYAANPTKQRAATKRWVINNPEKVAAQQRRWQVANPANGREADERWKENHPGRKRELEQLRYQKNPQKGIEKSARRRGKTRQHAIKISEAQLELIFSKQKGRCWYCGVKLSQKNISLDHIIAFERGGIHEPSNIIFSCLTCNKSKGPRPSKIPVQPILALEFQAGQAG